MKFTIIGSGNMAWFIAGRLTGADHEIAGVYGTNERGVREFAEACKCKVYKSTREIPDMYDGCILAVPDSAVESVANQLSFTHTVLMHTAGSLSIHLLRSGAEKYGVVWPVYSITRDSLIKKNDIPCAIEGANEQSMDVLEAVANSMRLPFICDENQRRVLHLCCVLANNFNNHLMTITQKLCEEHDVSFAQLIPIIQQTAERVISQSPYDTQTGPAIRNDEITIQKHVKLLEEHPSWQDIYRAITKSIREMYGNKAG